MQSIYERKITFKPCSILETMGVPKGYSASIPQFITEYREIVADKKDILLILCHNDFMSNKELRLFAVWCARQIQYLMKNELSITALDVAERYAYDLATEEELSSTYRITAINARGDACGASYATLDSNPRLAARDTARAACGAVYKHAYATACGANFPRIDDGKITASAQGAWKEMQDCQIDKLIEFFIAKENDQEFDWKSIL